MSAPRFLLAVDGGASHATARLADRDGTVLAEATAGPASLTVSAEGAIAAVTSMAEQAVATAGLGQTALADTAVVCALAGHRNMERRAQFIAALPPTHSLDIVSDAYIALIGAHEGKPGVLVVVGTGSNAMALDEAGGCHQAGGWGFPIGDEGGGAWTGYRALSLAIRAVDEGRLAHDIAGSPMIPADADAMPAGMAHAPDTDLLRRVRAHCGDDHVAIIEWLTRAQPADFAAIARMVAETGDSDPAARVLLAAAGREIGRLIAILDPAGAWPAALHGGMAAAVQPWLPETIQPRMITPRADALTGGLLIASGAAPTENLVEDH